MLSSFRIRGRLFVILGLNVALIGIMGFVAFFMATSINEKLSLVLMRDLPGTAVLLEADRDLHQMLLAERGLLLSIPGSAEYENNLKSYQENMEQADSRMSKFIEVSFSEEKRLWSTSTRKTGSPGKTYRKRYSRCVPRPQGKRVRKLLSWPRPKALKNSTSCASTSTN